MPVCKLCGEKIGICRSDDGGVVEIDLADEERIVIYYPDLAVGPEPIARFHKTYDPHSKSCKGKK